MKKKRGILAILTILSLTSCTAGQANIADNNGQMDALLESPLRQLILRKTNECAAGPTATCTMLTLETAKQCGNLEFDEATASQRLFKKECADMRHHTDLEMDSLKPVIEDCLRKWNGVTCPDQACNWLLLSISWFCGTLTFSRTDLPESCIRIANLRPNTP